MYAFQHVRAATGKPDFATLGQSKNTLLALVVGAHLLLASPTYGATLGTTAGAPDPSSSFSATTGLFSSTSGAVSITSAGTEIMRVNGTGVGFNTTSPAQLLDLNGVERIEGTGSFNSTSPGILFYSGDDGYKIGFDDEGGSVGYMRYNIDIANTAHGHIFSVGTPGGTLTDLMLIRADGNVGIGTTAPGTTLNVNGTITLGIAGGSSDVGMYKNTLRQVTFDSSPTAGTGITVNIGTSANQGSTLIVNGDVGIGTTAPDTVLSLGGQSAQTIDMVRETTASTAGNNLTVQAGGAVLSGTNLNGGTLNLASGTSTGTGTSGINFKVYEAGSSGTTDNSATTAMVISGAGNVGIRATSPGYELDVRNSGEIGELHLSGRGNDEGGYLLGYSTSGLYMSGGAYYNGTNWIAKDTAATTIALDAGGGFHVLLDTGLTKGSTYTPTIRLSMNTSGNVGIGTNTPRGGSTLDVNGKVYVATFAANSSTTVCQNANALSTCTSARRYKEKIEPSRLGLKEVLAMKPVTFDLKDHKDNWEQHDFGFIAEDMEAINPLFVTYDEDDEGSGVRYMQLTAVNTKAIQELQGEIDELKRAIEQLTRQQ
jgi:hypothetical protein